jgi:hypothetical protein
MNRKFFSLSLVIPAAFWMAACSDSEISSSDISTITQSIFIVPEGYTGEPYNRSYTSDEFYVNVNEKIRICGVYSIDGKYVSTEKAMPYYNTHKWTIDNEENHGSSVYYSFSNAGIHNVTFETVDHLGDTLVSRAKIYVNTPAKVTLLSPANNYNQVDGDNEDGLELAWSVYGVDSWETASCILYAGYDINSVWNSPLGKADCFQSINLTGKLDLYKNNVIDSSSKSTNNTTIYWGIKATTESKEGYNDQAFSDIFSFSTKLHNEGDAIIQIPVSCLYSQFPEKFQLTGIFISSAGDTLSAMSTSNSIIQETLPPQSNLKVLVCDDIRKEYGCDSIIVDLAPSTKTITDTLFLRDRTKPNMIPVETELHTISAIRFYILDNGSGINASKVQAVMNGDTLETKFEDNILSFENTCQKECNLIISAEDYARNKVPEVYWKIKVNKTGTSISGPYARMEDNE